MEVYNWLSISSFAFSTWQRTTACSTRIVRHCMAWKKKLGNPQKDCGLNLGTFAARLLRTASTYPRTSWDIHLSSSSGFTGFLSTVSWKDSMYMNGKYFYKNEEQMPHNSSFSAVVEGFQKSWWQAVLIWGNERAEPNASMTNSIDKTKM